MQVGTDFSKRLRFPISKAKTSFDDGSFFLFQLPQQRLKLLIKRLGDQQLVDWREALVANQVFQTQFRAFTDWGIQRYLAWSSFQHVAHVFLGHAEFLRYFIN